MRGGRDLKPRGVHATPWSVRQGPVENRAVTRNQAMAAAVLNDVTKSFGRSEVIRVMTGRWLDGRSDVRVMDQLDENKKATST
jgi:hypothetical protein